MKLLPDDPKLTAYALGEANEAERVEVEAALAESPECRQAVEEICQLAGVLTNEFASEPVEKLDEARQQAVMASTKTSAASPQADNIVTLPQGRLRIRLAMAASLMGAVGLYWWLGRVAPKLELASSDKPMLMVQVAPKQFKEATNALQKALKDGYTANLSTFNDWTYFTNSLAFVPLPQTVGGNSTITVMPPSLDGSVPHFAAGNAPVSVNGIWVETPHILVPGTLVVSQRIVTGLESDPASAFAYYHLDTNSNNQFGSQSITAAYPQYAENAFMTVAQEPLSTFSTDVDTASYANVRRFLNSGQLPPRDAVRIEEMVNYFSYHYAPPTKGDPFSVNVEAAGCPWNTEHRLLRIALKGRELAENKRPPSNFVFLIDVSGSMEPAERLPLLKQSLRQLVKRMTENDHVALVVYAGNSGVVLPSTSCVNKEQVLEAIDRLEAGGSTNGGEGIQRAYDLAVKNFIKGGVNRVVLCTDGDFNVGITDREALIKLVQEEAKTGVFLTTLGVGTDNLKDATLQQLADKGNGNYHYLDTVEEGYKVLVQQMNGTLVTIAKDVKIQIEFNPAQVQAYRLVGYEKRMLRKEDFNNDAKDAGEIGAGHTVTALYEIVPAGAKFAGSVDPLKYQATPKSETYSGPASPELCTVKLRYKQPDGDTSKLITVAFTDAGASFGKASTDFQFAAAVASFGQLLKGSDYKGTSSYDAILETAGAAKGDDAEGYRAEFLNLVKKAKELGK